MATCSLDIMVTNQKFGDLGSPYRMLAPSDLKSHYPNVSKSIEAEYKSVYDSLQKDSSLLYSASTDFPNNVSISKDIFNVHLPYEKGIPQTYKFLGMDINQDFQAVIPVGDGYVVVDEMYDPKKLIDIQRNDNRALRGVSDYIMQQANNFISKSNSSTIRKISTAFKTGVLYEAYQKRELRNNDANNTDYQKDKYSVTDFLSIINLVGEEVKENTGLGYDPQITSITLNLARIKEEDKQKVLSQNSSDASDESFAAVVIVKCLTYWGKVVDKYNKYNRVLSAIDLWSNIAKKVIGDTEFNNSAKSSFNIINSSTGNFENGIVAVTGVARNGSISDTDAVRAPIISALDSVSATITSSSTKLSPNDLNDLMVGNINIDQFDNPYELSPSELQAISNYDSLQQVDEDAKLCVSTYNLNDPEERGLFLKSAIKSYEKNFRDYKPVNNYDVTVAMSDLVERGESFKELLVPEVEYTSNDPIVGYLTTDTPEMIEIKLTRKNLLKVSKLIEKTLKPVKDLF